MVEAKRIGGSWYTKSCGVWLWLSDARLEAQIERAQLDASLTAQLAQIRCR